jgi:molybdopterin/thiamine biosynthesis adenylyltransferase
MRQELGVHIVLVGCGAIGSSMTWLLAHMPGVTRITLIDPDSYQKSNLRGQHIFPCDVGQPKVAVMARRLRTLNPELDVTAMVAPVEDVPLGLLRANLLLAGLDSRAARQTMNEIAWRLEIPWIDVGVLESGKLARVNVYVPEAGAACLECSWDAGDYAALEAEYPCGAVTADAPSDTSPALGALAGSLSAIELQKILSGDEAHAAIGRQVTVDARTHRMITTSFRRNPDCKFDHMSWSTTPLRCSLQRLTVGEALAMTGTMRVAGHGFVRLLVCQHCDFRMEGLRLDRPKARCPKCGARMVAPGFDGLLGQLDGSLPAECLSRSLAQVGLVPGDVVCGSEKQFELLAEVL